MSSTLSPATYMVRPLGVIVRYLPDDASRPLAASARRYRFAEIRLTGAAAP